MAPFAVSQVIFISILAQCFFFFFLYFFERGCTCLGMHFAFQMLEVVEELICYFEQSRFDPEI